MPHKDPVARKAYCQQHYQLHKQEYAKRNAAYRQQHHEEILQKKREWRDAHPSYSATNTRKWRMEHPKYSTLYSRKWRKANPEKHKAAVARQLERRKQARRDNPEAERTKGRLYTCRHRALGKLTAEDIAYIIDRDDGCCCICHHRVSPTTFSLDHIIPVSCGGDNSRFNLQLTHWRCNQRRNNVGPAQIRLMDCD